MGSEIKWEHFGDNSNKRDILELISNFGTFPFWDSNNNVRGSDSPYDPPSGGGGGGS